jgi:hypothetical protein
MTEHYSAGAKVSTIGLAGEIALASQKLPAAPDRLLKRQILEAMEWIVVHEVPHRPVARNHFTGDTDDAAKRHATSFKVGGGVYWFHVRNSITTVC